MITFKNIGHMGRFCNSMFQIAGTIGIAIKSQQPFVFPTFRNYDAKDRFGSVEDIDVYKHFVNQLPEIPEGMAFQDHGYFWGYEDVYLPVGNWSLNAHFQSERFFKHAIDTVRHHMIMTGDQEPIDAVAVHVRRGDYDGNFHPLADKYYYERAFGHVPTTRVLLFSDDMKAAGDIMDNIGVPYEPIDENGIDSFKIMKRCKHFVCANSSYSLMAAILADQPGKRVVCPADWFGPSWGNQEYRNYMAKDIYPENAIVL